MIIVITILVACLIFVVFNLIFGDSDKTQQNIREKMKNLNRPNAPSDLVRYESEKLDRPLYERLFAPLFSSAISLITKIAPTQIYALAIEKKLRAGSFYRWSAGSFIFMSLFIGSAFAICTSFLLFDIKHNVSLMEGIIWTISAFLLGIILPIVAINSLIAKRQTMILRQLPEMLDLVCVSVQAGLSFDGALTKVVEKMTGPLVDECRKMLQEVKMGMTRREALVNMANRCQVQEISLFTASIIQSDRLGVAMSKTLVIQSENMRERRRQQVKELALKAPVKMIFPLALFIFPVIFIVVLMPSALTIISSLGQTGK